MAKDSIEEIVTLYAIASNHNFYKGDKLVLDWKNMTEFEEQDIVVLVTEKLVSEKKAGDKVMYMNYIRRANGKEEREYWADLLSHDDYDDDIEF
jgi:hypothetical protein